MDPLAELEHYEQATDEMREWGWEDYPQYYDVHFGFGDPTYPHGYMSLSGAYQHGAQEAYEENPQALLNDIIGRVL